MGPDVHAGALTGALRAEAAADHRRPLRDRADPLLSAVIFALFARTFLFQAFEVPSASMEKNVLTGDHLLVNKFVFASPGGRLARWLPRRPIRRGDVIVFKFPEDPRRDFIKRVIALPGETVEIRDKRVFVDGRLLGEPYAFHSDDHVWPDDPSISELRRQRDQLAPRNVPANSYFVLGDNRDDSHDSRFWGPVPVANLEGRAMLVYWSLSPRPSGAGRGPGGAMSSPLDLLRRTRWDRAFLPVR